MVYKVLRLTWLHQGYFLCVVKLNHAFAILICTSAYAALRYCTMSGGIGGCVDGGFYRSNKQP